MLDAALRRLIDPPLDAAGRRLAAIGVGADAVTLGGFAVGLLAVPLIAWEHYAAGLAVILANRLADGLDGAIARRRGPTDFGGYLDIVCDFIFYAAFAFAFGLARPELAVPAGALMLSFIGTGTSFLAYAIIAEKRGLNIGRPVGKSFFYARGLAEGGETVAFFTLCVLWPSGFAGLAYGFSVLCWLTTALRVAQAWRAFGRR